MANVIDILINALWTGGGATAAASTSMTNLGAAVTTADVGLAASAAAAQMLNAEMAELAAQVARGTITIEAATAQYNKLAASMTKFDVQTPKAAKNYAGLTSSVFLASAAFAGLSIAVKKGLDAIKGAAELELTKQRFDRLAESIGTTGDALQRDLAYATKGLLSDFDAMASATDFMALGLVNTHDEAVRLAAVASQLGFDMNQLVLTLTNMTTMRFDALGVSVAGFKDKVNDLEAAGHSAESAFTAAFLEQAEEQIERVGDRAEFTAGRIDMIEAAWTNAMQSMKESTIGTLGPFIDLLTSGFVAANEAQAAVRQIGEAAGDTAKEAQAIFTLTEAIKEYQNRGQFGLDPGGNEKKMREAFEQLIVTMVESHGDIDATRDRLVDLGIEVDDNGAKIGMFKVSWEEVEEVLASTRLEAQASYDAWRRLGDFVIEAADSTGELTEEMKKLESQIADIKFNELLEASGLTSEQFTLLVKDAGSVEGAIEKLRDKVQNSTQANLDYASSFEDVVKNLLQFVQTSYEIARPALEERAKLFEDFQLEMSSIAIEESAERERAEEQYETGRTDIVERYGERRALLEEDYARQQARNMDKLAGNILDVQESSIERQADIRENANERLEDLEQDHADRMLDIIRNADAQLAEAAGRLDAAAVVTIQANRERALEDEQRAYERSHQEIQNTLDDQLSAEQAAAERRIADLNEYHNERQRLDEEDHLLRLGRMENANAEQLSALDDKHTQELISIQNAAAVELGMREIGYYKERQALGDHFGDKAKLEAIEQGKLLKAEEDWWKKRTALIPDLPGVDAGLTSLPTQFFGTAGASAPTISGDVIFNISGADSPEETGDSVLGTLEQLFGSFG